MWEGVKVMVKCGRGESGGEMWEGGGSGECGEG